MHDGGAVVATVASYSYDFVLRTVLVAWLRYSSFSKLYTVRSYSTLVTGLQLRDAARLDGRLPVPVRYVVGVSTVRRLSLPSRQTYLRQTKFMLYGNVSDSVYLR